MRPLRHSYTNRTLGDGTRVVKCYEGPDALARLERERVVLHALKGRLPLPQVLDSGDGSLTMTFMGGIHGQELLEAGRGSGVLGACGAMLRRIHQLDFGGIITASATPTSDEQILVHGGSLLDLCHRHEPRGPREALWAQRIAVTGAWHE